MHEIYEFGKSEIWQIRNNDESPLTSNWPRITVILSKINLIEYISNI